MTASIRAATRSDRVEALAGVGVLEWRHGEDAAHWSPQLRTMFGFDESHPLDAATFDGLLHDDDRAAVAATLSDAVRRSSPFQSIHRMLLADRRTVRVFSMRGEVTRDASGATEVFATLSDITEHQEAKNELAHLATHDSLTGVHSRRAIMALLTEQVTHYAEPGALLVLDIDHLTDVNDLRGHDAGDAVLRTLCELLARTLPEDALLGRLGGDEFAAVLPGIDCDDAVEIADRICDVVHATPFLADVEALRLSVSIGVTAVTDGDAGVRDAVGDGSGDVEAALAHAALALHEAKRAGGNCVRTFSVDHRRRASRRMGLQQRLARALDEDAFEMVAQPIVDLRNDQISAYELLLRLRDGQTPELGPRDFLPTAERSALAGRIDRWVVERAVAALATPRARRRDIRLQINVTGRTLEDPAFGDDLLGQLHRAGVAPYRLGVEITETAAIRDTDNVHRLIDRLGNAGCPIVLDDFGTGFGSLLSLRGLSYAAIKVSGPLICDADRSPRHRAVVEGMVRLARGLGMQMIAEEVDRELLLEALRDAGVRGAQGWLLGAPRPLTDLVSG